MRAWWKTKGIMEDNNIYSIRCQLYNHKGPGYVIDIRKREDNFVLYCQESKNKPDREIVLSGRIDFNVPFQTKIIKKSDFERIISKAKDVRVSLAPPMTGRRLY